MAAFAPTAAELSSMANEAQLYMDKTVVIERAVRTPDGAGHTSTNYTAQSTTIGSMGAPQGAYMAEIAARLSDQSAWLIQLPNGTDVQRNDHLVIGSDTLTVQHVFEPSTYSFTTQVLASQVR